jgi:hypothetical protein
MFRRTGLCLAFTLLLCAPAAASDLFPPSPVPSSRDNIKPQAKQRTLPKGFVNAKKPDKIVKTTKGATGTTGAINTGIQ